MFEDVDIKSIACERVRIASAISSVDCLRPYYMSEYEIIFNLAETSPYYKPIKSRCISEATMLPLDMVVSQKAYYICLGNHGNTYVSLLNTHNYYLDFDTSSVMPHDAAEVLLYAVSNDDRHVFNIIRNTVLSPVVNTQYDIWAHSVAANYAEMTLASCPSILNFASPATEIHDSDTSFAKYPHHSIMFALAHNCTEYYVTTHIYARSLSQIDRTQCSTINLFMNRHNNAKVRRGYFTGEPYLGIHKEAYVSYAERTNSSPNKVHRYYNHSEALYLANMQTNLCIMLAICLCALAACGDVFTTFAKRCTAIYQSFKNYRRHMRN